MNRLFHKDIGFPADLRKPTGTIRLQYSFHARQAAQDDRYGAFTLPTAVDTSKATLIEAEQDDFKRTTKVVYRAKLDETRDICIVFIPEGGSGRVKTVWVNLQSDKHRTLDRSKYARP